MSNIGIIINIHIAPVINRFCSKIIRLNPNILLLSAQKSMKWNNGGILVPNISDGYQLSYFSRNGVSIYRVYWRELPDYYNAYGMVHHHINLKSKTVEKASDELVKVVRYVEAEKKIDRLPSFMSP